MTVNGSRRFRGNDKRSYFVQDTNKEDRQKGKYILTVMENGIYKLFQYYQGCTKGSLARCGVYKDYIRRDGNHTQ